MSYKNPRIKLEMSFMDIFLAMAEGNPGAITVLTECAKAAPLVDPDNALGPLGPLCQLDNLDCYGSRIWMFYKDVCGQNIRHMLGALRSMQLGFVSGANLNDAISGDRSAIDLPSLLAKVKERLPAFQFDAVD